MAVPNIFGTATAAIPLSQLDTNFATAITLGNTAVYLGNTTTSLGNVTLTNVTISSGNVSISTATVGAGSNTAPSITTTGDTNTGIFFPAADTIAFTEGGVEAARIDSSGNFGIGTSSPAYKLDVSAASGNVYAQVKRASQTTGEVGLHLNGGTSGVTWDIYQAGSSNLLRFYVDGASAGDKMVIDASGQVGIGTASPGTKLDVVGNIRARGSASPTVTFNDGAIENTLSINSSAFQLSVPSANPITFLTTNAERMRISSAGDVGIGTSSPAAHLEISGTETGSGASLKLTNTTASTGKTWHLNSNNSGKLFFSIPSVVDAMIIDSSGNVLVGTTSTAPRDFASGGGIALQPAAASEFASASSSVSFINYTGSSAGSGTFITFRQQGAARGSISTNGSVTAYNTSSDYRLKNTIAPMTGALAKVSQLKPVTYKWNANNSESEGFIAHELAEVVPQCVTGEKDEIDADGNPVYQGIDVSFLVATLTAAIQEQQALITTLTARITALENK